MFDKKLDKQEETFVRNCYLFTNITKIVCCGQVHLLLSEKVKVSQTSQSRPAALTTTALHTALQRTAPCTVLPLHTAQSCPAALHTAVHLNLLQWPEALSV